MSHKSKRLSPRNVLPQEESQTLSINSQKEPFNLAPYVSPSLKSNLENEGY